MTLALLGATVFAAALALAVFAIAAPGRVRLPRARRRPPVVKGESALSEATEAATGLVGRLLHRRSDDLMARIELAGLRTRPQDFAFLVSVASLMLVALALLLGFGIFAGPLSAAPPLVATMLLRMRTAKRRKAFAEQLDGTLQLMASSLRAGLSMLQALASVAKESEEPTSSELARVVNQTRVGRPVVPALEETAVRMGNEDFRWAAQAIAINREVGGSLAEVLDGVAGTIRERSQIRRHVAALSAEGRLSAAILMLLPVGVGGFIWLSNPSYLTPFVETPIGYILIAFCVVLFIVGGVWLRKVVEIEF